MLVDLQISEVFRQAQSIMNDSSPDALAMNSMVNPEGDGGQQQQSGGEKKQTKSVLTAASVLQSLLDSSMAGNRGAMPQGVLPHEEDHDDHDAASYSSVDSEADHRKEQKSSSAVAMSSSSSADRKDRKLGPQRAGGVAGTSGAADVPMSFPQKLMEILEDKEHTDVISWLPHGKAFIIYKKKKFEAEVMPKYFKQSKFTSFTRKLNRWGFTRVKKGPEAGAYYHEFFKRGNVRLSMQMCCQKVIQDKPGKAQMGLPGANPMNHAAAAIAAKMKMMQMDPTGAASRGFSGQLPYDPMSFAAQQQAMSMQGAAGGNPFDSMAMAAALPSQTQNDMFSKFREAELLRQRQQQMLEAAQLMEIQCMGGSQQQAQQQQQQQQMQQRQQQDQSSAMSSAMAGMNQDPSADVALQYSLQQSLFQQQQQRNAQFQAQQNTGFGQRLPMGSQGYGQQAQDTVHDTIIQNAMKNLYNQNHQPGGQGVGAQGMSQNASTPQQNSRAAPNMNEMPGMASMTASPAHNPAQAGSAQMGQDPSVAAAEAAVIFQRQLAMYREREREKLMQAGAPSSFQDATQMGMQTQQMAAAMAAQQMQFQRQQQFMEQQSPGSSPDGQDDPSQRAKRASAA